MSLRARARPRARARARARARVRVRVVPSEAVGGGRHDGHVRQQVLHVRP